MNLSHPSPEAYQLFHDGSLALAKMEANGIRVDVDYLDKSIAKTARRVARLEEKLKADDVWKTWRRKHGVGANLGSLVQMGDVLFNALKLKPRGVTATGRPKMDEETLRKIDLPFVQTYLKLEKLKKVKSTYLEGIQREVCEGFLHPMFSLSGGGGDEGDKGGASSYRGSSSLPNAQNIPMRNPEYAKLIRRAFIPRKGCRLISRDFSGIEVKVAACVTKDPVLIKYLTERDANGKLVGDMHHDQAMNLFLLKDDEVEKRTTRDAGKNRFVFPECYGSVWFQCAPSLWEACGQEHYVVKGTGVQIREHLASHGITELGDCEPGRDPRPGTFEDLVKKAEDDLWNKRFTTWTAWKKKVWADYQRRGWTRLVTGFICRGYYRRNQVLNQPIQGPAFHCLLWCIIQTQKLLDKYKMKSKLVLQIHDDLIGDVPEKETQDYLEITEQVMTKDLPKAWPWLIVPIETEVEASEVDGNWWEKKPWERANGVWKPKLA